MPLARESVCGLFVSFSLSLSHLISSQQEQQKPNSYLPTNPSPAIPIHISIPSHPHFTSQSLSPIHIPNSALIIITKRQKHCGTFYRSPSRSPYPQLVWNFTLMYWVSSWIYLLVLGLCNHRIVDCPLFFIVMAGGSSIDGSCRNPPHLS